MISEINDSHNESIYSLDLKDEANWLTTGCGSSEIKLWELETKLKINSIKLYSESQRILNLVISNDHLNISAADDKGFITFVDTMTFQVLFKHHISS